MELQDIKKALKNDDQLFVKLIQEKQEKLMKIAYRYYLSEADVEDVLSETIYKAYRNRKKCKHPEYFLETPYELEDSITLELERVRWLDKQAPDILVDIETLEAQNLPAHYIFDSVYENEKIVLRLVNHSYSCIPIVEGSCYYTAADDRAYLVIPLSSFTKLSDHVYSIKNEIGDYYDANVLISQIQLDK